MKSKTKLATIIFGTLLLATVPVMIYLNSGSDQTPAENSDETQATITPSRQENNETGYSVSFPSGWQVSKTVIDDQFLFGTKRLEISSPDENFLMGFESYYQTHNSKETQKEQDSGAETDRQQFEYKKEDFEEFATVGNTVLYISKSGLIDYFFDGTQTVLQKGELSPYSGSGLTEKMAENQMTEQLTIFDHTGEQEYFVIFYYFNDADAIEKWPEYKEIFREFVLSLSPLDNS